MVMMMMIMYVAQVKSLHKGEMGEGGLLGRVSASTNMFLVDGLAR